MTRGDDSGATASNPFPIVPLETFESFDFEASIRGRQTVDCYEFASCFRNAAENADELLSSALRLLATICEFHLKAYDRGGPYGPIAQFEGRRSAIPADFLGEQTKVLAQLVGKIEHAALRARVADVAWLNDKKDSRSAIEAVEAYVFSLGPSLDLSEGSQAERDEAGIPHIADDLLRRALDIGRAIGWEKSSTARARDLAQSIRAKAARSTLLFSFNKFAQLDLDFGISDPREVAEEVKAAAMSSASDPHLANSLWRLAARAYRRVAKSEEEEAKCLVAGAECHAKLAELSATSALQSTHHLMQAIEEFRQVRKEFRPRKRIEELQATLVTRQSKLDDEMAVFQHEFCVGDIVEKTVGLFKGFGFADALKRLALIERPVSFADAKSDVLAQAKEHPLMFLFGGTHHDAEGKVSAKTAGLYLGEVPTDAELKAHLAPELTRRRQIAIAATIRPAMQVIFEEHFPSPSAFEPIAAASPIVPPERLYAFSRGLARMFSGNFYEASALLFPQLENSFRYVLRQIGKDVSLVLPDMTQEDVGLHVLLTKFRPDLDQTLGPNLMFNLEMLFTDRTGPNLRNRFAHGTMADSEFWHPDTIYACWLIFRMVCLPLIASEAWETVTSNFGDH